MIDLLFTLTIMAFSRFMKTSDSLKKTNVPVEFVIKSRL